MAESNALHWGNIEEYLGSIGMRSDIDIQLTKGIFSQAKLLCPEEFKDIFVSNYNQKDDKEQFKDVWLYSDNYVVEALNFNKQESPALELAIFSKNIQSILIETKDFDLSKKAKDNSRLHIKFYTYSDFSCDQIAFGSNCDTLKYIYKKYVKHNLVRPQSR